VEILPRKSAPHASAFLKRLIKAAPFKIAKVLTDNSKEFSDRFCATGQRAPTGNYAFDQACAQHAIEHRLITPKRPQTHGMIERFNGRITEILNTTRFRSGKHLHETISRYVMIYREQIPQRALNHATLMDKLKAWHRERPDLLHKRPYNHPGLDRYGLFDIAYIVVLSKKPVPGKYAQHVWSQQGITGIPKERLPCCYSFFHKPVWDGVPKISRLG
jgi:hypothetical protein